MPAEFTLPPYRLRMLTADDLDEDYAAVMRSSDVLRGIFGPDWPVGLTRDYDLTDLHWHHREFTAKRSFAWVIRANDGTYLGCAYLYPEIAARGAGVAPYWFADMPDRLDHLAAFGAMYENWLRARLPDTYALTLTSNKDLPQASQ